MRQSFIRIALAAIGGALAIASAPFAYASTANDFSSYVPYTGNYAYGSNMGYYGTQFKDQDIAQLAYNAGVRTVRPSLPDWLITGYGADARTTAFQFYQSIGMIDLTAFVGEPNEPSVYGTSGPDDRETKQFPGTTERARTFKGLYEPVWLDSAKTQINPANTFASYLYKTVKTYGLYVKFWEIVNEPDFTYGSHGWQIASADSKSWWNVNPDPEDLTNLKAPIQYYVHELRVAYDVIKTLQPNEYIATGGIGYASFLDALLRNTDNPVDGSVTTDYPLKAGAYFDVLSFHTYPMYNVRHWDNSVGGFVYTRHSDAAVDAHLQSQTDFRNVLEKYGYNGSLYPKKQWLVTETDIPQETIGTDWGGLTEANNYIMKAHILGQVNGIMQTYKYGLGENDGGDTSFNRMGLYGNLSPASTTIANAPKTEQFKAIKTLSTLLYGKKYDANKTAQLNLPSSVRGAAFTDGSGKYTYALWAKTTTDLSENVSATYSFPFTFNGVRDEWDYSATNNTTNLNTPTVTLTSAPSFFVETGSSTTNTTTYTQPTYTNYNYYSASPVVNAGSDKIVALSTASAGSVVLSGTATSSTNSISQYRWNQVSGPTTVAIANNGLAYTTIQNLTAGTYVFRLTATDTQGAVGTDDVTITVTNSGRTTVSGMRANLRSRPWGKIIGSVSLGDQGLVLDHKYSAGLTWTKVSFDKGMTGWVASRYLQNL